MKINFIDRIDVISPNDWRRLNTSVSPFLSQEYFKALEETQCVSQSSGWQPHHMVVSNSDSNQLTAILPSYIKQNSWGEFVFDWDWAEAFERHGYPYYPKLISTIPFTPISTNKLISNELAQTEIFDNVIEHCQHHAINSWHILFCPEMAQTRDDVFQRHTVQFHWFNRHYHDFDDFVAGFTSRQRKNTRKERLSIAKQGIEIHHFSGDKITARELDFFYLTYRLSYLKRGHTPHLTKAFFGQVFSRLADSVLLIIASYRHQYVASALFFFDRFQLYGRYWGCTESFDNLHFELCYYQGIEFCIRHNLQRFNPGAQGEHKIKRGFEPIITHSYHWIKQPEFRPSIKEFCQQERLHLQQYKQQCQQALPFKAGV